MNRSPYRHEGAPGETFLDFVVENDYWKGLIDTACSPWREEERTAQGSRPSLILSEIKAPAASRDGLPALLAYRRALMTSGREARGWWLR